MIASIAATREDVRELKARTESEQRFNESVRQTLAEMREVFEDTQQEVRMLSRSSKELTDKVSAVFTLHEEVLKKQAEQEQLERDTKLELLQNELKQREERHAQEMKQQLERFDEKKFVNKMKKNWLPFIGGVCAAIIALATIVLGIAKGISWVISNVKIKQ